MVAPVIEFGFKEADRPAIVALFREYWAAIGLAPSFQNFESEVAGLPGEYAPPRGQMIVARDAGDGSLVACVSLRPFPEPGCCEMKRLYVRPVARGTGLGRRLALAVMDEGAAPRLHAHVPRYAAQLCRPRRRSTSTSASGIQGWPRPILPSCCSSASSGAGRDGARPGPGAAARRRPQARLLRVGRPRRHAPAVPARHAGLAPDVLDRACVRARAGPGAGGAGPLGLWPERRARRPGAADSSPPTWGR